MPDPIRLGFPVSFLEAIRWAENRKAILPESYYGELAKELRSTAFTVSGISRLDVIDRIMTSLTEQTKAGATFASWKKWVAANAPEVLQLPKGRAETIFRNAIQTNYGAGRWEQQWAARDVFPYLMYSAINDARTRPAHRALSGIIRPIDDPFWQTHTPPLGHNCRCSTIALTEKQAQRRSGADTGLNKSITPEMRADPGWDYHPVLQQQRMEEVAKEKLDRMGAMMRVALENAARAAPVVTNIITLPDEETRDSFRWFQSTAGWKEKGGDLIRDTEGNAVGRTKWIAHEQWWQDYKTAYPEGKGLNTEDAKKAIQKVFDGKTLGKRQKDFIEWCQEWLTTQRGLDNEYLEAMSALDLADIKLIEELANDVRTKAGGEDYITFYLDMLDKKMIGEGSSARDIIDAKLSGLYEELKYL